MEELTKYYTTEEQRVLLEEFGNAQREFQSAKNKLYATVLLMEKTLPIKSGDKFTADGMCEGIVRWINLDRSLRKLAIFYDATEGDKNSESQNCMVVEIKDLHKIKVIKQ